MADGKVILSTELDNSGIEKGVKDISGALGGLKSVARNAGSAIQAAFSDLGAGSKDLETAVREAAAAVDGIGDTAKAALQKQVDAFAKQNSLYAQQKQKVMDLQKELSELSGKKVETDEFAAINAEIDNLSQKITGADKKIERFFATGGSEKSSPFQKMAYDVEQLQNELERALKKKQEMETSGSAYKTADTSGIDQKFTEECEKLRLMHSSLLTSFDTLNAKISEYSNKAEAGTEATAKFSSGLSKLNGNTASATESVRTTDSSADSLGEKLDGGLSAILKYGIGIRSLYALFSKLRAAAAEGFTNLVKYDSSANKSASALTSSLTQLKNSFATAFAPILNVAAPALTTLINLLSRATTAVGMFFAAISGKGTFMRAVAVQEDYAESLEGSAGAAKKLQQQLSGLDEISTWQSDSSGGGGGGTSDSGMFEEVEIPSTITNAVETIKSVLSELAQFIPTIIAGIAGLTLGKFLANLLTANTEANTLKETIALIAKKAGLVVGITLAITGITLEVTGIVDAVKTRLNQVNFAEILGGGGMLTAGAALIGQFFGSALLGGAIGAIVAGVPAFVTGIYDAIMNGIDWLSAALISASATAVGAGIGAIVGMLGGPVGAGIGALIGLAVGLATDLVLLIVDKWDEICAFFAPVADWFDANVIQPVSDFFSGLWESISQWASEAWKNIKSFYAPAVQWFSNLLNSILQTWSDIFYNIGVIASGCWTIIKAVWGIVADWFSTNVIQPVSTFFTNLWAGFLSGAKSAWEGVKSVFGTVAAFFKQVFSDAWAGVVKVFSVAGEIFVDIKDGILTAFKAVVNGIIRGINSVVSVPFNGINTALKSIKGINILGLTPFSSLRTINVPQIPYLAQGAVLPANKPFLAMVGDQKSGTNVEAPLTTIEEAVENALRRNGYSGNGKNQYNVTINARGKQLLQIILEEGRSQQMQSGSNPFLLGQGG